MMLLMFSHCGGARARKVNYERVDEVPLILCCKSVSLGLGLGCRHILIEPGLMAFITAQSKISRNKLYLISVVFNCISELDEHHVHCFIYR